MLPFKLPSALGVAEDSRARGGKGSGLHKHGKLTRGYLASVPCVVMAGVWEGNIHGTSSVVPVVKSYATRQDTRSPPPRGGMAPCRVCVLDLVRGQPQRRGRPGVATVWPPSCHRQHERRPASTICRGHGEARSGKQRRDRVGVASSRRAYEIRATSLGRVLTIVSTATPPEKGGHCNMSMPRRKGDCRPARSTIVPPSRQGQARSSAVDCSTDARAQGAAPSRRWRRRRWRRRR